MKLTRITSTAVRVDYCPAASGSFLLPRPIGLTNATELIYTGRIIDAAEADSHGLLNALVGSEALADTPLARTGKSARPPR